MAIRIKRSGEESTLYDFGKIECIYVYLDIKLFITRVLQVQTFVEHTKCYIVTPTNSKYIITHHHLFLPGVFTYKKKRIIIYVLLINFIFLHNA